MNNLIKLYKISATITPHFTDKETRYREVTCPVNSGTKTWIQDSGSKVGALHHAFFSFFLDKAHVLLLSFSQP